jgi:hypothetical protein
MNRSERAQEWLAKRSWLAWALVAVVLTAPSLGTGLAFDDYFFAVVLRKLPLRLPQTGALDLFRFADGDAATARALMDEGTFPWTADPAARNAFLRPISALTHAFDFAVWPSSPVLMHLHSLLWYAMAVAGAALVYRRLLGAGWVAGLAALLYAVDDGHAPAVAWIANRNAFIAAALGLPVLWLHDRWRREGWKAGRVLGPLLFAVSLLAGESAIAVVAYLIAYALHLDRRPWRERLSGLAAYLGVVVAWRAVYTGLGYGVRGSDIYIDPLSSPRLFLRALPHRYVADLVGQLAVPRADFAEVYDLVSPSLPLWMMGWGVLVLAAIAIVMVRLWRNDPLARFFATGMMLAAVPITATMPSGRLLAFVGLGAMGLVGQFFSFATTRGERAARAFLAWVHLAWAPLMLAVGSAIGFSGPQIAADRATPATRDVESKTVVLVNPPFDSYGAALIASRLARGEPRPASVLPLACTLDETDVERADAYSLRVRPENGFLEHAVDRNWRSLERPLAVGSVVELGALTATVTATTEDHRPLEALFRFRSPLEDASFVWLRWRHGAFERWDPPPVGETQRLAGSGLRQMIDDARGSRSK